MTISQLPRSRVAPNKQASFAAALEAIASPAVDIDRIDLTALSNLGRAEQDRFHEAWRGISPQRRRELVAALLELSEAHFDLAFNDLFRWLLEDDDPLVRARAIDGLWEDANIRQITPLLGLLHGDPAPEARAAAAISLGRFVLLGELGEIDEQAAWRVEEALRKAYDGREREPAVRRRILESLAYSGRDDVGTYILEAYQQDDRDMQISAVCAMGRNADTRWRPYVLAELSSADNALRFEAVRASGELGLDDAVTDLIDLLGEKDIELRDSAIWSLGQIGGQQALRALRACARSEDEDLREAAQEALAELDLFSDLDSLGTRYLP